MKLTNEDREWIALTISDAAAERDTDDAARLIEARVETLVARHVTAALNAAAEGVERLADDFPDGSLTSRLVSPSVQVALRHAADGVRNAANTP